MNFLNRIPIVISILIICSCENNSRPDYSAVNTQVAPIIDGVYDVTWDKGAWEPIYKKNEGSNYITDSLDLSGYFKSMWDDKNLYYIIKVTDDRLFDVRLLESIYDMPKPSECDCIELFIDAYNDKKSSFDETKDDNRFEFIYNHDSITGLFSSKNYIDFEHKETINGYILEIKIPFKTLKISDVKNGDKIGCEICINDNDNKVEGEIYTIKRAILTWSEAGTKSTAWENTKVYGTITLK